MLLQVTTPEDWAVTQAQGSLSATPFLHLCTKAQLPFVLDRHFQGRTGLLLLSLDPATLDIRWEPSEPGMDPFPHLYGKAPLSAVTACTPLTAPSANAHSPTAAP
jgi:uncharacterized protein (DUF952 family)